MSADAPLFKESLPAEYADNLNDPNGDLGEEYLRFSADLLVVIAEAGGDDGELGVLLRRIPEVLNVNAA